LFLTSHYIKKGAKLLH